MATKRKADSGDLAAEEQSPEVEASPAENASPLPTAPEWPKTVRVESKTTKIEGVGLPFIAATINDRKFYAGEDCEVSEDEYRTLASMGVLV